MALIRCSECGKKISDSADTCPNCGIMCPPRPVKKPPEPEKEGLGLKIALIVIGTGLLYPFYSNDGNNVQPLKTSGNAGGYTESSDSLSPAQRQDSYSSLARESLAAQKPPPEEEQPTPLLEVQSWKCYNEYGYVHVEGEVKNISKSALKNVEVVATHRTSDGEFVTSSDAFIEYNPILPDQISPFKTLTTDNPASKKCNIDFKFFSGATIEWIKKDKSKKQKKK